MNKSIQVAGVGAVSPAGWTATELLAAVQSGKPIEATELARPGREKGYRVKRVPKPTTRPAFLANPRLRRTSPISHFAVSAAFEALGVDKERVEKGEIKLGVVLCAMSGCVNYSRRFYDEVLRDPATASPLVFPETVFNAPSSHLAALLGATGINYTIIGDPGMFVQGLALGAQWIQRGLVDACLVVSAEESDWLTAEAMALFDAEVELSEGAGAIYLKPADAGGVQLDAVTDAHSYRTSAQKLTAVAQMQSQLDECGAADALYDSTVGVAKYDVAEMTGWTSTRLPRVSVKKIVGESFAAASAWQCVVACAELMQGPRRASYVSVVGCNQQAIGARWVKV